MSTIPFRALYALNLLSLRGLWTLLTGIKAEGTNLMPLLRFAAHFYPNHVAISDGPERLTFSQLYAESSLLARSLSSRYALCGGKTVVLLCSNSTALVRLLFAVSRTGANLHLLNTDMSTEQLQSFIDKGCPDLIVSDDPRVADLESVVQSGSVLSMSDIHRILRTDLSSPICRPLSRGAAGRIVVFTGGTSGQHKAAARRPSVFAFLYPFFALLRDVGIYHYKSVYIATPIYHGFGLATLIVAVLMGRRMELRPRFNAIESCRLISKGGIEVAVLVPTMLRRMLREDVEALRSLRCILSGGATLSEDLAAQTGEILGGVLYNLYGSSEAGFFVLATPDDLARCPGTIGHPIRGVQVRLMGDNPNEGSLQVCCGWAMDQYRNKWQDTGDRAYRNEEGYLFLRGRIDSMIVSGGENVYPEDVERVLCSHPDIEDAAVIAIDDPQFGQRLRAYIVLSSTRVGAERLIDGSIQQPLSEEEILAYLKGRLARYQMPADLRIVDSLPRLNTGKLHRAKLAEVE